MALEEMRRSYYRAYRLRNRDRINLRQREWAAEHPEKIREYRERYLRKLALSGEKNSRTPWPAYNIDKKRLERLCEIVRSGRYDNLVRSAAYLADEAIAEYILLSVTRSVSFDAMEKMVARGQIERPPCSRTGFYCKRRLFFHYLDTALQKGANEK